MTSEPTVGEHLAVINVKLDLLLAGKDDHEDRLRALEANTATSDDIVQISARTTALEQWKWVAVGAALAGGGVSTAVAQLFVK